MSTDQTGGVGKGEIWKPIAGYPGYEVSSEGRVRSWKGSGGVNTKPPTKPRMLKRSINNKGYRVVGLCRDKMTKTHNVHTLVATAFHGRRKAGKECSHLNGNRADCRASNLVWETHLENVARQFEHGTNTAGTRNGRAKLSVEQVRSVRSRHDAGESLSSIAREFGMTPSTTWQIYHKLAWKSVTCTTPSNTQGLHYHPRKRRRKSAKQRKR